MTHWHKKRIAIAYGGVGNEREVSLKTGAAFADALRGLGLEPALIDLIPANVPKLIEAAPDVVLIAMHGTHGEDGCLQGMLELLGIPYTGSGVGASAIAMDKVRSKCVFERFGVPTPEWAIARGADLDALPLSPPFVVKPALEGSSVGVAIVRDADEWLPAWRAASACRGEVLVERFVAGREMTVGVFDGEPMGIIEVEAAETFYDYEAKYVRGDTRYSTPKLEPRLADAIVAAATDAYRALGCRGVARVDVLLDADDRPWVLEANTVPGMTETSLVPKLAAANGVAFDRFVLQMLDAATTDADAAARGTR